MSTPQALRILFAGTPGFAVVPLQALVDEGLAPIAVLTQPDRPAGRGRELQPGPVKRAALAAGLAVHQPGSLKEPGVEHLLGSLAPDVFIVVAYGLLLPTRVLEVPRHGCWNIHASLLPRWRGAAPIQRTIESGDHQSGVTVMQMDAGLDTGPVLRQQRIDLDPAETSGSLHDRLAALGAGVLLDCLRELAAGRPPAAIPQAESGVTYAEKLSKDEARLDWREPAALLERRVRAFNPWPVAWFPDGTGRTRVWRAAVGEPAASGAPGSVTRADQTGIDIVTGAGVLRLLELQPPGGRPMSAAEYVNGRTLPARLDCPA